MDYRKESPDILRDFLTYHEVIKGHSKKTVNEYFLDLRTFFRYLKLSRGLVSRTDEFENIPITDIDLDFIAAVTLTEVYDYLSFLSRDREKNHRSHEKEYGLSATTRARKVAVIRSFYKYLTVKAKLLKNNPIQGLDSPKVPRALPHYLSIDESKLLLDSVDGKNRERDYCIICIFLNCGVRISELVNINLEDISQDHIRVFGKGSKERVLYLNDSVAEAINAYIAVRSKIKAIDKNAFFLSNRRKRISTQSVHSIVKNSLKKAGLDADEYSAHKLRHTAATLMLQNGVDVRTLQELLGHEHLNTTQIYTHIDNTELRVAANANPLAHFKPDDK